MTALTEQFSLDDLEAKAREVRPGRTLLTALAAVLFGIGWVTARVFAVAWLAFTWSWVAVREGWRASHGPSRAQRLARQAAEITELKTQLGRFGGL